MKCKNCKHWAQPQHDAMRYAAEDLSDDNAPDCWSEPDRALDYFDKKLGNMVRECRSPKLNRVQNRSHSGEQVEPTRPRFMEASAIDGEGYYSALLTDEDFGCVNFEPK